MSADLTVAPIKHAETAAALQREAESELPIVLELVVADAESYEFADHLLTETVRRKDAAEAMRKTATAPLRAVIATIDGWFAPIKRATEAAEAHLKKQMGGYRLTQAQAEREAREAAAQAADKGESENLVEALTLATELAAKPAGRATAAFVWAPVAFDSSQMPREYLMPDAKKVAKIARAHKGDTPPAIPGVKFERQATIGAKR